jgi:hypothetical protein
VAAATTMKTIDGCNFKSTSGEPAPPLRDLVECAEVGETLFIDSDLQRNELI